MTTDTNDLKPRAATRLYGRLGESITAQFVMIVAPAATILSVTTVTLVR